VAVAPRGGSITAPLTGDPLRAGVFCDFDGTLAPIVVDPTTARAITGAGEVFGALALRFGRVAVVSGRPAGFLLAHFAVEGVELWGLHGLETVEEGRVVAAPGAEPWRPVVTSTAAAARRQLAGAEVEDKGLSLTLHYRRRPDQERAFSAWAAAAAESTGLEVHPARRSVELRPPVPHGKGTTVTTLAAGLAAACFAGDDWGDLDAFEALDRLAEQAEFTAVKVGVDSPEAPAPLLAGADVVVDGPAGVLAFLRDLVAG
jgi:trehalose 6-phosphate phosphatase